ncbi:elongation factor P 5-aminopentanone reductase [Oceanobacillus sp. CAU 1775]
MGKNILVIGASGDIGRAISLRMAKEGYQLLLHYHKNLAAIEELVQEVKTEQILQVVQADLTTEEGINSLLNSLVFSIDSIIFANGNSKMGLFQDVLEEEMDEMITLHLKAPMKITKHFLPSFIRKGAGKIIFITSVWGEVGASNEVLYSTVKGAQNSFVKSLAKEIAHSGVSIHAISPGFIDTKMNASLSIEDKNEIFSSIPLRRAGQPSEVADAVVYLLHAKAKYLNGQVLQVSGGWII